MTIDIEQLLKDIKTIEYEINRCQSKKLYLTLTRDYFSLCFIYDNISPTPYEEKAIYNPKFDAYELEKLDYAHHQFINEVTSHFAEHLFFVERNLSVIDTSRFKYDRCVDFRSIAKKEALDILLSFASTIGDDYYKLLKQLLDEKRLGYADIPDESCQLYRAYTQHSFFLNKSYSVYHLRDLNVECLANIAHEVGHAFEMQLNANYPNSIYAALKSSTEVCASIIGYLFLAYLRENRLFSKDTKACYDDVISDITSFLLESNIILNLSNPDIDINTFDVFSKQKDRTRTIKELDEQDHLGYLYTFIKDASMETIGKQKRPVFNLKTSLQYSYGNVIAMIFQDMYLKDPKECLKLLRKLLIDEPRMGALDLINNHLDNESILDGTALKLSLQGVTAWTKK